jgi:ABC-type multidrug transport system ATPase subunit
VFAERAADPAVRVAGVIKRFGSTVALAGVDLEVPVGTVFGLLGPNGAGKTTLVRVLATLLAPDAGRAEVFGHDLVHEAAVVRGLLGLTGQFAAVDEILTGRENLQMFGRLFDLSPSDARRRAGELLERFDLADAADRPARTYSGGCAVGWISRRACSPARGFCFSMSQQPGWIRAAATRSGRSSGSSSASGPRYC